MGKTIFALMIVLPFLLVLSEDVYSGIILNHKQSEAFRSWFARVIAEQFRQGPSPRWIQRDCAGLIRFATYEALRKHDETWLKASGLSNRYLPPEVNFSSEQEILLNSWKQIGSSERSAYAPAITIIQENSRFISKYINQALPGDILFFDQGEDQHLMVWMGNCIAYHTGRASEKNTGLRKVSLQTLMNWKDTRWQPTIENPNFIGIYRFIFLSF